MATEAKKKDSAEKRHKQNVKARLRNRSAKTRIKTAIKSFEGAVKTGDETTSVEKYKTMVKLMDTAAGKKIFHKNTVARKKSRMSKLLKSLKA
ncbi:MAG: 30S ribosomal protein S20 [Spirochaetes bacterium GWB1_48_6]|nr:MAG: 30S ribosomal protein S20 [Spirochaetes bacterium GWB1_48_6]